MRSPIVLLAEWSVSPGLSSSNSQSTMHDLSCLEACHSQPSPTNRSFVGGAPGSSGGGSSSTTPTSDSTPAAAGSGTSASPGGSGAGTGGAGQTESKVAAQKVSSPGKFNLATVPQSGDLATTLQQTGTGSGTDNSTAGVTEQSITGGGTSSGTGGGTGAGTGGGTSSGTGGGTSSGASGGTAGKFFQCGGSSWSGPTSCESGTTCQVQNQCKSKALPSAPGSQGSLNVRGYEGHLLIPRFLQTTRNAYNSEPWPRSTGECEWRGRVVARPGLACPFDWLRMGHGEVFLDFDVVILCSSEAWLVVGSRLIQKVVRSNDGQQ